MTHYQRSIREHLKGRDYDPRHIEGYMRLQYSALDHLDRATFAQEVEIGVGCIKQGGVEAAERNAQSFGL